MALKPTITIGTGYEEQQRKAASRRKIAEAMLAQGLQSNPNMSSWAQVLGQMAQAWAGKSMQRQADTMDADVAGKVREDYNTRRQAFLADVNNLPPQQIVAKYGNDPYLEDEVKPYREALATALKEREGLGSFGGRMVRRGDVLNQYANDPNDTVFADPNGNLSLNPVKIAGAVASQGLPMVDEQGRPMYQTTGMLPGASTPGINGGGLPPLPQQPVGLAAPPRGAVPNIPFGNPLDPNVGSIPSPSGMIDGKPYWIINGKAYDNPEGR